ncbi:glutamate receptor ionotropic, NMDA 3A-like [Tubulanus polymorphus]|uniref:glutamate receptor ionotropic, NMDA 3A-like n=1 Tax=Tubulanus polymorphus TaxID=672921 RepID=UPI003DA33467
MKLHRRFKWVLSESAFTKHSRYLIKYPPNAFVIRRTSSGDMQRDLMRDAVNFIGKVAADMLRDNVPVSGQTQSCWHAGQSSTEPYKYYRKASYSGRTGYIRFDTNGYIIRPRYDIWTLFRDVKRWPKDPIWIRTAIWENSDLSVIFRPHIRRSISIDQHLHKKRYKIRVATSITKPFVDVFNMSYEHKTCTSGHICLQPNTTDPETIRRIFHQYSHEEAIGATHHSVLVGCCHGLCIDLLTRLSTDMNFNFDLYIVKGNHSGEYSRKLGRWTGLTGDLISGAADIAVAPMMVSSERSQVIDFSLPYLHTPLSLLMARNEQSASIGAFMEPLDWSMWLGIFITLHITALAATFYEWHSPYGLTPNGRDRAKVFSLPSALNLCWSILFSHTVPTKSPKCWSSRFLLNVWACFSLVFLASYTANLAAFMVGDKTTSKITGIHDYRINPKRCATVRGSDAEYYMKKSFPQMYLHMDSLMQTFEIPLHVAKTSYQRARTELKTERLIKLLRDGRVDLLVLDRVVLEYYVHTMQQYGLEFVGSDFGNLPYGVGLQKNSPFTNDISMHISKYENEGYLENLYKLWFERMVGYKRINIQKSIKLNALTFSGVFLLFAVGILLGCVTLILELIVYRCFVPKMRRHKSRWVLPYSQRLFRVVQAIPKYTMNIYADRRSSEKLLLKNRQPLLRSTERSSTHSSRKIREVHPYEISHFLASKKSPFEEGSFIRSIQKDIKNNEKRINTCNIAVQTNIEEHVNTQLKHVDANIDRRLKSFEDDLRSMREQLARALREKEALVRKVSQLECKPRHIIEEEIKRGCSLKVRKSPCKISSKGNKIESGIKYGAVPVASQVTAERLSKSVPVGKTVLPKKVNESNRNYTETNF